MNPAIRVITFEWINNQMAGDELLELWKKVAGVWSLVESIPVDSTPEQTHEFTGSPGTAYVFQLRGRRNGAYRTDYQSANPDDWPAVSRLAYTADLPTGVLAFTGWTRTSGVSQQLGFAFSNVDPARVTKFYRDDGGGFDLIATIAAGTFTYDYIIQGGEPGATLTFKVTQEDDDAVAETSNALAVFAGIEAPTNLTQIAPIGPLPNYGYTAQWVTGHAGAKTRVSDHWIGAYQDRALSVAGVTQRNVTPLEQNSVVHGSSHTVQVNVRVQHELTSFAVTDLSDWTQVVFDATIYDDETAYLGP